MDNYNQGDNHAAQNGTYYGDAYPQRQVDYCYDPNRPYDTAESYDDMRSPQNGGNGVYTKKQRKRILLIAIPVLLLCLIMLAATGAPYTPYGDEDWYRFTEMAEAIVVDVKTETETTENGWRTNYKPTYEYVVDDEVYTVSSQYSDTYNKVGKKMEILYDPDKPEESVIYIPDGIDDDLYTLKMVTLFVFLPVFGFPFLIIGLIKLGTRKNNQQETF